MSLHFLSTICEWDNLWFTDMNLVPGSEHQKAAVLCHKHNMGGKLYLHDLDVWSPYDSFQGFGMMWGFSFELCSWDVRRVQFAPAQEHSWYDHNGQGDRFMSLCSNQTRWMKKADGTNALLGNGRTFGQIHDRVEDGPQSYGTVTVDGCVATRCGHAGMLAGHEASGGAAFTVGGNNGQVYYQDCSVREPLCGALAVWTELTSAGEPKGYEVPSVSKVTVQNFGVDHLIDGYTVPRNLFDFSGTRVLEVMGLSLEDEWIDHDHPEISWNKYADKGIPDIQHGFWS